MLLYHHCRALESVVYSAVKADPKFYDPCLASGYEWLEKKVGFAPLFLAVGDNLGDIYITGYEDNWRKYIGTYDGMDHYRRKGEFPNSVLFSFSNVEGIFTDYGQWHLAMGSDESRDEYLPRNYDRLLFKPSWKKSKWERHAKKHPGYVQLVAPSLDLRDAERICVRNGKTRLRLLDMGFRNVEIRRIPVA